LSNELIINSTDTQIEIALLENNQLMELNREKSNIQFTVGDIYLGKVKKIMPGLNAAFVDVGYEKDAFLHYLDLGPQFKSLHKYLNAVESKKLRSTSLSKFKNEPDIEKDGQIGDVLSPGQTILVQIAKEPISTKGPRLTSEISIAGRHMVLLPFYNKVSVSQKLKSIEERKRLKNLISSIKPKNYGVIVRTAGENKRVAVLDAELRGLVNKWESSFDKLKINTVPKHFISELNRTSAILRDILNVSFNNIHVNDNTIYREVKDYISTIAPEKEKIVKLYTGEEAIFDHFGVEKQIKGAFGKTVSFKKGAYLIIEHTEALHVIDVNSGNRARAGKDQETNALEVNISAAEEIARQLRLRDMGGIIVVDFIDMQDNEHKQLLFEKMKEFMSNDRTKHNILPLSKFGLMQITRQRVRPEMHIETTEKCPTCAGSGEITPSILIEDEIENQVSFLTKEQSVKHLTIKAHPFMAAYLTKGIFSKRYRWGVRYKCKIKVLPSVSYSFLEFHFFDKKGEEMLF